MRRKAQLAKEIFVSYIMLGLIVWTGFYQHALKTIEQWPYVNNLIIHR